MPADNLLRTRADKLFAEFIDQLNAGEDADFEELCRSNPELEDHLRDISQSQGAATSLVQGVSGTEPNSERSTEMVSREGGTEAANEPAGSNQLGKEALPKNAMGSGSADETKSSSSLLNSRRSQRIILGSSPA